MNAHRRMRPQLLRGPPPRGRRCARAGDRGCSRRRVPRRRDGRGPQPLGDHVRRRARRRWSRPRCARPRARRELIDLTSTPGPAPAHGRHRRGAVRAGRGRDARRLRRAGAPGGRRDRRRARHPGVPVRGRGDAPGSREPGRRAARPVRGTARGDRHATRRGSPTSGPRRIHADRRRHRRRCAAVPGRVQRQPEHRRRARRQGGRGGDPRAERRPQERAGARVLDRGRPARAGQHEPGEHRGDADPSRAARSCAPRPRGTARRSRAARSWARSRRPRCSTRPSTRSSSRSSAATRCSSCRLERPPITEAVPIGTFLDQIADGDADAGRRHASPAFAGRARVVPRDDGREPDDREEEVRRSESTRCARCTARGGRAAFAGCWRCARRDSEAFEAVLAGAAAAGIDTGRERPRARRRHGARRARGDAGPARDRRGLPRGRWSWSRSRPRRGNANAATDAGVAGLLAAAAARGRAAQRRNQPEVVSPRRR